MAVLQPLSSSWQRQKDIASLIVLRSHLIAHEKLPRPSLHQLLALPMDPSSQGKPHLPVLVECELVVIGRSASIRSHGSAESGILQRHHTAGMIGAPSLTPSPMNNQDHIIDLTQLRRMSDDPPPQITPFSKYANHSYTSGISPTTPRNTFSNPYQSLTTPRARPGVGVAGEQRSLIQTPKPAFPLNVTDQETPEPVVQRQSVPAMSLPLQTTPTAPVTIENIDYSPYILRQRALSVFEEESESESVAELPQLPAPPRQLSSSPSQTSPLVGNSPNHTSPHNPRSRWLNARSSPNIFGSVSKSDVSDDEEDEEDDDIVELMTTSGRFPNKGGTFPRTSPGNSPLLTSRKSPTHYLTGSSDEEMCSVFESGRKHRHKRMAYRKRSMPNKLVPMDSISSDDGLGQMETRKPHRKERLLRLRPYNSLPTTPAENSGSESLTDLLDSLRRKRSGSCRTDSSLSDGGGPGNEMRARAKSEGQATSGADMRNLAKSMVSKFDLSDEDSNHVAMETEEGSEESAGHGVRRTSTTLRSVFCTVL